MIWGTLKRIHSTHQNMRTDEMIGEAEMLPEPGKEFRIYGEGLTDKALIRMIETTRIKSVTRKGKKYTFDTENSRYSFIVSATKSPG